MFKRKRSVDEFAEEIKAHLELEANELEREGVSEEEARRRAKIEFGNVQAARERFYLRSRVEWLDNLVPSSPQPPPPSTMRSMSLRRSSS